MLSNFLITLYLSFSEKIKNIYFIRKTNYPIVIILGHPRSGTSLLHTNLNSHYQVHSLNEPLKKAISKSEILTPQANFIKYLGFKFFYEYFEDYPKKIILEEILQKHSVKIINIKRRNLLRVYTSLLIAQKTKEWSSTSEKTNNISKKIHITPNECEKAFLKYKKLENDTDSFIKNYNIPFLELYYENYIPNQKSINNQIIKFLGIKQVKLFSLLKKQNPENLSDLIENYSELEIYFKNTIWNEYFIKN